MVNRLSKGVRPAKGRILQTTHPVTPRPQQTVCHHHWRLQGHIWRNSPTGRLKWRMAPLLLPLTILLPRRKNYDIYNRELLAVIRGLKTWKHYLWGSPFPVKVFTDHKNLLYFKEPHKLNRRQAGWMLDISDYDLKLIHVPGRELAGLDALPRRPNLIPKEDNDNKQITLLPKSLFVNTTLLWPTK